MIAHASIPLSNRLHHLQAEEVVRLLDVDLKTGLPDAEARERLEKFGANVVRARRGTPAWLKFLQQFHQPLVYILLLAGGVTAFLGEWVDTSVIVGVVLVNAIVGFLQETKAEMAIEALARMILTETTVRRDGHQQRVRSESLVPGDVVLLQSGDRVPADLRLLHARGLQVDESALTGESVPVHKHTNPLALDYAPLMNELFHTAPLGTASWLRITAVAAIAFAAVELEKWIRFGGRRGEHAIPN